MTRARGRGNHQPRGVNGDQWPETGEAGEIGASDRTQGVPSPIPGGQQHIVNPEVVRQDVPAPIPRREIRGENAHGVEPGSFTTRDRADMQRGPAHGPRPAHLPVVEREPIAPVPVYVVSTGAGQTPLRTAYTQQIRIPAFDSDPVKILGRDVRRGKVHLMNGSTADTIAFARHPGDLSLDQAAAGTAAAGGAILPAGMTSYQGFTTSDELWAITNNGATAATLYMIVETQIPGAGT